MKTVLPLYAPLPTPEEMHRWDEAAHNDFGISPLLLMENAARAALDVLKRHTQLKPETSILIFMGTGNNGGDGAALARMLYDEGCNVLVYSTGALDKLQPPAAEHVAMAKTIGVNFLPGTGKGIPVLPMDWRFPDIVVDALTGTGLRGELRSRELAYVRIVNSFCKSSFILALDTPSGLCGYTGKPKPEAVRAHVTIAFEAGKPGLFVPAAHEYTGTVVVRRVGIPLAVRTTVLPSWELLSPQKGDWALPSPLQHKGDAGKVLIIGGSEGMAGAPFLAALGSLRGGAGLVHVAFPAGLEPRTGQALPEVLPHPVGSGRSWQADDVAPLLELVRSIAPDMLVMGPGMGRTQAVREILQAILEDPARPPVLLDADALFFFHIPDRGQPGRRQKEEPTFHALGLHLLNKNDILTPHPGEMARMLSASFFPDSEEYTGRPMTQRSRTEQMQTNRSGALSAFTRECSAVLVLKGAGTLIGRNDSPTILSPFAVSTLAVGGSGDVLSGLCAALAASGVGALDAACLGVYLHGRAGELLAQKAPAGHLARDIADAVPRAWKELCEP